MNTFRTTEFRDRRWLRPLRVALPDLSGPRRQVGAPEPRPTSERPAKLRLVPPRRRESG